MNGTTGGWQVIDQTDNLHDWDAVSRGIADVIDALGTEREPLLSAHFALKSTEIIFAAYESSRRRGRVDLPLTADDNPFVTILGDAPIGREGAAAK